PERGNLILFQLGGEAQVTPVRATLRVDWGKRLGYIPEHGSGGAWNFLWVVSPPLFEYSEELKHWVAAHHAFTRPRDADIDSLLTDPGKVKCDRYDVVLNGFEIGGGPRCIPHTQRHAPPCRGLGVAAP